MRDRLIFTGQLLFTLLVAAFLVVPAILSISAGVTVNYFRGIQSGVTLQWVFQVWDLYAGTILLSFVIAFATLAVTLIAGVPAAYALHIRGGGLSRIIEEIITLPLAIPGLAIALGLLLTYGGFGEFRRSWLFILTGHVIFTMPFMVRSVMAVFATADIKTLDEGAASLGASPWRRFRDVIVPNAMPGDPRRRADGGDAFARGIQSDLDAAHAADQDAADRACRQLCVDAAGSGLGLYADFLRDDHSATGRHADVCRQGAGKMKAVAGHGASVRIEACGKTFADGTRALEPATLDIARGETLVLLGPSGCGKTTMLRIIAGLERPDPGGRLSFDGKDVTSMPIEQRNVGMVFQSYALFPNMSVADNIGYGLKIRGMAKPERAVRVAELVKLTNISGLEHRRIDQLSGGQRQRVALARAVAIRPGILLLDEPLTALDAALRDRLRGELDRLLRTLGITTIYVTHDQSEAMALGDRIVVMQKGAMAQIGTPREIYFTPRNRFVAEFIGAANIVEAPVENGHWCCRAVGSRSEGMPRCRPPWR